MANEGTSNSVSQRRRERGLGQMELARRVGLSRQALSAIESGRSVPSTSVALRLARALECSVEALFWLDDTPEPVNVHRAEGTPARGRVRLARVDDRWVAHPVALGEVADAELVERGRQASLLDAQRSSGNRVLVAGCDPALGLLAGLAERAGVPVAWIDQTSTRALRSVARHEVHIAGTHLYDAASGEHNLPFVKRLVPKRACVTVELASTREGLVVAAGNPLAIRSVADLARQDVRVLNRAPGSAARELLDRELVRAGIGSAQVAGYDKTAASHEEVARAVAIGATDTGIATDSVALAHGLELVPLHEERFDLVVPAAYIRQPEVERLLSILNGASFRRQLRAAGGYETRGTGREVGRT